MINKPQLCGWAKACEIKIKKRLSNKKSFFIFVPVKFFYSKWVKLKMLGRKAPHYDKRPAVLRLGKSMRNKNKRKTKQQKKFFHFFAPVKFFYK
jgi:hypothetical protein